MLCQKSAKQALVALALGLLTLVMAACGTAAKSSTTTAPTPGSSLLSQKHAALMGVATLTWDTSTKNLLVTVTMTGLAPNSRHPAHIHTGSCASTGPILYKLDDLVADKNGNAAAKTVITHMDKGIAATGWSVNVHEGPGLATPAQMAAIACGNISNPHASTEQDQNVIVKLNASSAIRRGPFE